MTRHDLALAVASILESEGLQNTSQDALERAIDSLLTRGLSRRENTGRILVQELVKYALEALDLRTVGDVLCRYPRVRKVNFVNTWAGYEWLCGTTNTWL